MATDATPDRPGRLLELAVSDLALIDRLRLPLAAGLNVLTGETGAGKSLLIDALGLATGARADTSLVRHGAESARVEALFDRVPEPLIAAREVSPTGRSTARLDDETVTAGRLAIATDGLVEIHGQHDQQRLLDEDWQRDLLDAYGGHEEARAAVGAAVDRWRANRAALAALTMDPRELLRRLEIVAHEAEEIEAGRLRPGEADEITRLLAAAQHGETIAQGAVTVRETLLAEGRGARERVAKAEHELRSLARLDDRWGPLADRLAGLEAEVEDVAAEVRALAETVDHDPASLASLEDRLGDIHRLLRRYGDDEAAVIAHGERARAEVAKLSGLEDERALRAAEDAQLLLGVADAAASLSILRRATADELGRAVSGVLAELGFPADAFEVAMGRRPAARDDPAVEVDGDAVAFDASGIDTVVFTFRPNPGEPARPLAKIASGGELSRVALAVKQVLADVDQTPVLVFDEIDTGIGGRSADPVGRSLWALARAHQVLCVTHLPQIAAYADAHYRIAKRERDGRTVTEISLLDRGGREAELAQMIGGPDGGEAALASARELLDRAEAWRGGRALAAGA
ncbi:MAG TPA: DNA repair protein RecN [Candidatus Limnocylindrales bacterium]|nr:DNA repair protein RecN [Candidatus Limnocylindrales bacterium]